MGKIMNKRLKLLIPAMIVMFALALLKTTAVPQDAQASAGQASEIQITAKKYSFSPDPIRVRKGDHVKLVITSTDKDHGIKIDAFHVDQKLKKDVPTTVEFTADQAGTFPFKCSVFCGIGHGGMKGVVIVEE
jgi:heme/copper-type cytochrome/quinol oxidase subunit 2